MDSTSVSAASGALAGALDQQMFGASLINKTLDKLNTGSQGMTPTVNPDYAFQKDVLSAAYADQGIGTKLDTVV